MKHYLQNILNSIELLTLKKIVIIGISFRILLLVILSFYPLYYAPANFFYGPLTFQDNDLNFYLQFSQVGNFDYNNFLNNYINISKLNFELVNNRYPGPLFPLIIYLFSYNESNPYVFSLINILCEFLAYMLWSIFLIKRFNKTTALLFAFSPIPLCLMIIHSADTIFYLFVTIIIVNFHKLKESNNFYYLFIFILLSLLVRPSALSIIISVLIYFIISRRIKIFHFTLLICLFIISVYYYSPYFFFEVDKIKNFIYLSNDIRNFIEINLFFPFDYLCIYLIKFFYLFGFIPSFSGNFTIYFLRSFLAIFFIFGFLISLKNTKKFEVIFINLTILFIVFFLYPTYRYVMPITPLLLGYSINYFVSIFLKK